MNARADSPMFADFVQGYLICALWSSIDEQPDGNGGPPMDDNYSVDDIAPDTLADMRAECRDFINSNRSTLRAAVNRDGYTWARAGHDFWLTRNGHGTGFWDRGELKARGIGDKLSEAAKVYGDVYLYVGDDMQVHS